MSDGSYSPSVSGQWANPAPKTIREGLDKAAAALDYWTSAETTATGSEQSIAHDLKDHANAARVPVQVWMSLTRGTDGAGGQGDKVPTFSFGVHTSGVIKVTCTAGAKFVLHAR